MNKKPKGIKERLKDLFSSSEDDLEKEEEKYVEELQKEKGEEKLKGIGGWLLFFVIGTILGGIFGFDGSLLDMLNLIFSIIILVLIFRRSKKAPRVIIVILSIKLLISFLSVILIVLDGSAYDQFQIEGEMFRTIVYSVIWIVYFQESKRVKNTFTGERPQKQKPLKKAKEKLSMFKAFKEIRNQ